MSYATIWRWHFYAGLFCIPLVLWLACTGAIYLWKPQIEALIDAPYDQLQLTGPLATPAAQAMAAVEAVPRSVLRAYELPRSADAATRIIVSQGGEDIRVYVDPQTTAVMKTVAEEDRLMRIVFKLHGELMMGDWGSHVVELAASWAIVLILSGLFLWWPRGARGAGGLVYPRLNAGRRIFWRDIHAVTGVWVSAFALFMLVSGLPWAAGWGGYLKQVRALAGVTAKQDWPTGSGGEHAMHRHGGAAMIMPPPDYAPLDRLVPAAERLGLAPPALLAPPMMRGGAWTLRSDAQNRPQRATLSLDPASGRVLSRQDFGDHPLIDRIVGYGVAAHEGQLFGLANQLLGLFTALGLVAIAISGTVMWWRRRPPETLGAPPGVSDFRAGRGFVVLLLILGLLLPALGLSLLAVLATERMLFRRIPALSRWLGLRAPG